MTKQQTSVRVVDVKKAENKPLPRLRSFVSKLDWLISLLVALFWFSFLAIALGTVFNDPFAGGMSAFMFVVAVYLSVMLWPPYTPAWRTLVWSWLLSMGTTWLVGRIEVDIPTALLLSVLPVVIFVFLRCNGNARRIFKRA